MEDYLGYEKSERSDSDDYSNGYTTNAIESLNSSYRKLNRQRSIPKRPGSYEGLLSDNFRSYKENGLGLFITGGLLMAKCALCTKLVFQTKTQKNSLLFTGKWSLDFQLLKKIQVYFIF